MLYIDIQHSLFFFLKSTTEGVLTVKVWHVVAPYGGSVPYGRE